MSAVTRLTGAALLPVLGGMLGCQVISGVPYQAEGDPSPLPRLYEPLTDGPFAAPVEVAARPAREGTLSVLSFNMHHRDRPEQLAVMAEHLRDQGLPDFILCQEVLFERSRWRGLENMAAELAEELGYHSRGTKRWQNREGVAIVSRYPFVYYDERYLRARTSSLLMGFRRVSAMGEVQVPGVGRVRLVTTHLAYQPWEGRIRRRQMNETLRWIAARDRVQPAAITIFGGDFNAQPGSRELIGLADPSICGDLDYENHNGPLPTLGRGKRVDYIFVASSVHEVRQAHETLLFPDGLWYRDGSKRFHLSDHLPVLHEYEIEPTAVVRSP